MALSRKIPSATKTKRPVTDVYTDEATVDDAIPAAYKEGYSSPLAPTSEQIPSNMFFYLLIVTLIFGAFAEDAVPQKKCSDLIPGMACELLIKDKGGCDGSSDLKKVAVKYCQETCGFCSI
ncbi:hypothetical protein OESDEN_11733 [Oesophagostomum dentatum]|uniref:ShKT domain-containing protein n=1 Tax=Oesophagostomum dentatum TaxID=61180 RepID=A0A0B1SY84_OESDE|nr:hypothetical protein OESDEN_11733 [Oesophagostomum dentatum]